MISAGRRGLRILTMTRMLMTALALTLVLAAGAAMSEPTSSSQVRRSCPVTLPNRTVSPGAGFTAAGFNYGNVHLRADLYWPHGTLLAGILPDGGTMAIVNSDGSISAKLGWWRGVPRGLIISPRKFIITGRRLDASAPSLRADVPRYGYGALGFIPTRLTFPTVGCWRVVGKLESAHLTFVVKVVKVRRRG